ANVVLAADDAGLEALGRQQRVDSALRTVRPFRQVRVEGDAVVVAFREPVRGVEPAPGAGQLAVPGGDAAQAVGHHGATGALEGRGALFHVVRVVLRGERGGG